MKQRNWKALLATFLGASAIMSMPQLGAAQQSPQSAKASAKSPQPATVDSLRLVETVMWETPPIVKIQNGSVVRTLRWDRDTVIGRVMEKIHEGHDTIAGYTLRSIWGDSVQLTKVDEKHWTIDRIVLVKTDGQTATHHKGTLHLMHPEELKPVNDALLAFQRQPDIDYARAQKEGWRLVDSLPCNVVMGGGGPSSDNPTIRLEATPPNRLGGNRCF